MDPSPFPAPLSLMRCISRTPRSITKDHATVCSSLFVTYPAPCARMNERTSMLIAGVFYPMDRRKRGRFR